MFEHSDFVSVRVLDLTRSYCGRLTTMALADLGCHVIRVHASEDDAQFTDRGKHIIADQSLDETHWDTLKQRADVIVEDLPLAQLMGLDDSPTFNDRGVIHCWLPAFAQDDDLTDVPGHEHTVAAASGMHDKPLGRKPSMTHLSILSVSAAAYALNGVLAALIARQRDGRGQSIRLVRSDVAYAVLELSALLTQSPPKSWATLQWAATPWIGSYPCADGRYLYIHAGLRKHLTRFLDAVDELAPNQTLALRSCLSPQTLRDPTSVPTVKEVKQIRKHVERILGQHPAWFWAQQLSARGLCTVEVLDVDQWFAHPHATETQHVVSWNASMVPGPCFEPYDGEDSIVWNARASSVVDASELAELWSTREPQPLGSQDLQTPPLEGVVVLDLTQVIAGPTAGRTLAELGARVHRIENPHFDAPWVEAFHVAYQSGKTQQTLDLTHPQQLETFWAVVDELQPDVVLHNLRPQAADKMGIGQTDFRARLPEVIYADMSAYGPRGPWGQMPGWEQTAQAVTGAQWEYGACDLGGQPELFPMPLNDLATGLFGSAAILAALWTRQGKHPWRRVCPALTRTATWMQGYAHCVKPTRVVGSSALGPSAFHRYYKAYDGWVFLHVQPGQERAMLRLIGLEHIPAYEDDRLRVRALERAFLEASVDEWIRRARQARVHDRVSIVPWRHQKAMFKSPRAVAIGLIHRRHHVGIGDVTETSSALELSRTPTVSPLSTAPLRQGQAEHKTSLAQTSNWVKQQAVGVLSLLSKR